MAIFSTEARLIGSKMEAVSGTAEVNLEYDVRAREADVSTLEVEYSDSSKYLDGTHTHSTVTPGIARMAIDSSIQFALGEFEATGDAATPVYAPKIPYAKYLQSAGLFVGVVNTPTAPTANDGKWIVAPEMEYDCSTITEAILDVTACGGSGTKTGIEYKGKGMMSTLVIESSKAGAPITFSFSAKGAVSDVTEVTVPVFDDDATLNTPSVRLLNTDIIVTQVNSDGSAMAGAVSMSFCSNVFKLDTGNTIGEIQCQADQFGLLQSVITGREPMLSISPLLEKISDFDFWGALNSENIYKIEIVNYSDAAKTVEQLRINIGRAQMVGASGADDGGFRRLNQEFRLLKNLQGVTDVDKEHDFEMFIGGITIDKTV